MADSKQLAILKAITAILEQITGYTIAGATDEDPPVPVDLSGKVYRGKTVFGAEETGPFLSILEGKRPDGLPDYATTDKMIRSEEWHLLIQGFAEDDADNPMDTLYFLKALAEKQLATIVAEDSFGSPAVPDNYMLGGLITELQLGPGIVRPLSQVTGGSECFYLPVVVTFVMNLADPFALT